MTAERIDFERLGDVFDWANHAAGVSQQEAEACAAGAARASEKVYQQAQSLRSMTAAERVQAGQLVRNVEHQLSVVAAAYQQLAKEQRRLAAIVDGAHQLIRRAQRREDYAPRSR